MSKTNCLFILLTILLLSTAVFCQDDHDDHDHDHDDHDHDHDHE